MCMAVCHLRGGKGINQRLPLIGLGRVGARGRGGQGMQPDAPKRVGTGLECFPWKCPPPFWGPKAKIPLDLVSAFGAE